MSERYHDTYRVRIGSQHLDLPVVALDDSAAIALLMTIDHGVRFMAQAGADLAVELADTKPDIVAGTATLGIPVAIEVTRALGLDDYLVLQKTPKVHLADALSADLESVTTAGGQRLLLDRARVSAVRSRRVVLVDDVIASGGSVRASLELLRAAGADVLAVGVLLTEGEAWRSVLGADAALVRSLGRIPGFRRADAGTGWEPT
jgi:adenine phosphoribosyltransferase